MEVPSLQQGRPPLLLKNDEKLLELLRGIRARGGVINGNVVRAAAMAPLKFDSTCAQQISANDLKCSRVHSVYKRVGLMRRMATTSRAPVPKVCMMKLAYSIFMISKRQ